MRAFIMRAYMRAIAPTRTGKKPKNPKTQKPKKIKSQKKPKNPKFKKTHIKKTASRRAREKV